MDETSVPGILASAWEAYGHPHEVLEVREISADVSTNSVYRLILEDGKEVVAKVSSYGSYVHFRQDHLRIHEWHNRLRATRFAPFLAEVLAKEDEVFTYREGGAWVVFYEKHEFYDFLPPRLDDNMVDALGEEMGLFHRACAEVKDRVAPTWQTMGADIASLFDALGSSEWRAEHGVGDAARSYLRAHCEAFLTNAEALGYHEFDKIPVLIDWNIGNFSIGFDGDGFKFFSRWDYDWFRIEPRTLDFYFCARVVREEGDQEVFSYTVDPFFEERFKRFLRAYHSVHRLSEPELLFLKEAYRFFILNYVIRVGEHFFQPAICKRLQSEAVDEYLPALEQADFSELLDVL